MQKSLNKIPWVKLPEEKWDALPTTGWSWKWLTYNMVSRTDLEVFLENLYRELARTFDMSYEDIKSVFMQENSAFFLLKADLYPYPKYKYFPTDTLFMDLQKLLIVPDIYSDNVNHILKLFESLTIEEQLQVLKNIGTIEYEQSEVIIRY